MSLFVGDQNQVVFNYESGTYAEPSGNAYWIGLVTDHTPTETENISTVRYAGTTDRNVGQIINTSKDYEGTITFHPQTFKMFGFALGSVVDSGSPSPYNHVISEINSDDGYAFVATGNTNFPSFTVIDSKKGQADGGHLIRTFKGAVVDSLNFKAAQGELVVSELKYIAQTMTVGSQTADIPSISDEDTSRPYIWSDVQVHLPSGTKINEVTDVEFVINNNVERRHYDNGSKVVDSLIPINREYEVTLTLDANSDWGTKLDEEYYHGGSSFNMMLENVISTGSEQGFIIMSGCKITSFESPSPAEGVNEFSVTITPQTCSIDTDDLVEKFNPW